MVNLNNIYQDNDNQGMCMDDKAQTNIQMVRWPDKTTFQICWKMLKMKIISNIIIGFIIGLFVVETSNFKNKYLRKYLMYYFRLSQGMNWQHMNGNRTEKYFREIYML